MMNFRTRTIKTHTMAKIHSHYDNLKVARKAPQEVIRAAYKALSQKYHPDKNPGDEKAARIMAIVNSAYGTLSDPVRRHEHDEWIAAEEWEIAWLDSTRAEESRELVRQEAGNWEPQPVHQPPLYRRSRDALWWLAMGMSLAVGCLAGGLYMSQPGALAWAFGGATPAPAPAPAASATPAADAVDPATEDWAVPAADVVEPGAQPEVKMLAVTELVIPARRPDCSAALRSLTAPNGMQWPAESGYLSGFPLENEGSGMSITVDNAANASPVLVKVFDLERRANVRHVYLKANDNLVVDKLSTGRYAVRYQNVQTGGSEADCVALRQAAAPAKPSRPAASAPAPEASVAPAPAAATDAAASGPVALVDTPSSP